MGDFTVTYNKDKVIKVTCAIIEKEGMILAAQRSGDMGMPFKWEFPGGKIEPGEKACSCIIREIKEEMDADIIVIRELPSHTHDYGDKLIELIPFICKLSGTRIILKEHKKIIWGIPEELSSLDWAEADIPIYKEYMQYLTNNLYN